MIDLHLHFDGSLPVETVWNQALKQQIDLQVADKKELRERLSISADCKSLNEYLEKFELPLRVLQTQEGIRESMEDLIQALIQEDMLYAEIRFAPQLHCLQGLTQEEVVNAAIAGVKNGCENRGLQGSDEGTMNGSLTDMFSAQLILCCMRGDENQEANMETVYLTKKHLGDVVCACDLAGAEAVFKTSEFEELFTYASALEVPYTIHAGEADGAESIRTAISFGAKRIGHGVHCIENPELVAELKHKRIPLECCPISNLHTKAVLTMEEHPVVPLLREGLLITINTDNRTVSDTTIGKEIEAVRQACGLTQDEEKQLYLNGVEAAFLSEEKKQVLRQCIRR